jgi:hypothetical protein
MAKKNSRGNSSEAPRPLTLKQRRFAAAYVDPTAAAGNGTSAARLAGYQGDSAQLAVQASVNLRNPQIQQTIATMLDGMVEHALQRVGEALDATKIRSFVTKDGDIICSQPEPDNKHRLDALKFFFDLRHTCGHPQAPARDQQDHDQLRPSENQDSAQTSMAMSVMDPADRIAFREAGEIEEQLAAVEHELEDDDDQGQH